MVGGDGPDVNEETVPRAEFLARFLPSCGHQITGIVHGKGEQIEGDEQAGQGVLAVTEVVFEVVPVVLEDVEGLVLNFPSGSAASGDFGHILSVHRQIGDEAIAVGHLAIRLGDFDFQPIDGDGVLAIP